MMKKIVFVILVATLFVPNIASSFRCDELLLALEGQNQDISQSFADGLIVGVVKATLFVPNVNSGKPLICLPDEIEISGHQAKRIVLKYLKYNPKHLHVPFEICAIVAMQRAFPCPDD